MKYFVIGGGVSVALALLFIFINFLGTAASVATAPGRVIQKTLETDNIINNYEWFHDANASIIAKQGQIQQWKGFVSDVSTEASEKSRLRIELAAIQQSCRELAAKYNANATKSNRSIFMGTETPDNISEKVCE